MAKIPRSQRHGTEPDDAVSDLPLRRLLSRMALVAGVLGAALCAWAASDTDMHQGVWIFAAAVSAATAVVAAIDLGVIRHRMHERILRTLRFPHQR
jgi:DNA-binding IclR family transcriptional regulator